MVWFYVAGTSSSSTGDLTKTDVAMTYRGVLNQRCHDVVLTPFGVVGEVGLLTVVYISCVHSCLLRLV